MTRLIHSFSLSYNHVQLKKLLSIVLVFILLFWIQIALHMVSGSFKSELGGHPDEAAHFVTGLMVHDFVNQIGHVTPMRFAEDFYIHYPKVALGHWPPVFYAIQTIWMDLFSATRLSALLLNSFLTTMLAYAIFLATKKQVGSLPAFASSLLFLLFPLVQELSGMVMAEIPMALFLFLCVYCLGKLLDDNKLKWIIGFTIFGILSLLTKGNAYVLIISIPVAISLCRTFTILQYKSFWISLTIIFVPLLIWYIITANMVKNGMSANSLSINYIQEAVPFYSSYIIHIIGLPLLFFVMCGLSNQLIIPFFKGGAKGIWGAFGSLALCTVIFHWFVPAGLEQRHLIIALPSIAAFIGAGISYLVTNINLGRVAFHYKEVCFTGIACLALFAGGKFYVPQKHFTGLSGVAQELCATTERASVFLISSDPIGEGIFISEVAANEARPGKFTLRASKVLSKSLWNGSGYRLLYTTPAEIQKYLDKIPVDVIVMDNSSPTPSEDHVLLKETLNQFFDNWRIIGLYDFVRNGVLYKQSLAIYMSTVIHNREDILIDIDLTDMLGRMVHAHITK